MNTEEKFVCISTTFLAHFWIPVTIFIRRLSEFKIDRRKLYNLPFRFEPDTEPKFAQFLKTVSLLHHALCTGLKMKFETFSK